MNAELRSTEKEVVMMVVVVVVAYLKILCRHSPWWTEKKIQTHPSRQEIRTEDFGMQVRHRVSYPFNVKFLRISCRIGKGKAVPVLN
jgi:hypothetical protein